jgi:glycine betaine/proline transport system substrate-binding protein
MKWLKDNPGSINAWLAGVTTLDGKDGLNAVQSALEM